MTIAKGPRPWSIWVFAALFLIAALNRLVLGLASLPVQQEIYQLMIPWEGWNRDWTIVALSAVFSIAFIPVAWIFLFAASPARILVTCMGAIKLINLPGMVQAASAVGWAVSWHYWLEPALTAAALICLFVPQSNQWFKGRRDEAKDTFS
ncbi:MAG: hypothetical protein SXU28_00135 [Pseudomonadota bacterium]|nr:hypothetical protein [Pseudomonadota bacterium]